MRYCSICKKKITGKTFKLEIIITKEILTLSGYGKAKDSKQMYGHYHCLQKKFKEYDI